MLSKMLSNLSATRALRRIALPMLERFNPGDIHIRHHYTRERLLLHTYRHKGYWFHGRRREQATMNFFQQVLRPGDAVVEVGGHIGYLTMLFADLVGSGGRVIVFEPGQNNLPYLRANAGRLAAVKIIEMAVSDQDSVAAFFEEELTGQNNSLLVDYKRFAQNRSQAFSDKGYQQHEVRTIRLDSYLQQDGLRLDLIKIDIEGAELLALRGAATVLAERRPMLMIEVTHHADEVLKLLTTAGYSLFTPEGRPLQDGDRSSDNICALHADKHRDRLQDWLARKARAA
jgi:FkbM family methyltransferase